MAEIKDKLVTVESLGFIHNQLSEKIDSARTDLSDTAAVASGAVTAADRAQSTASNALIAALNAQATADGKVAQTPIEVILASDGWEDNKQTITVAGVTTDNTVIIGPAPECHIEYSEATIYCLEQADNCLIFCCEDVPSNNITVNVVILDGKTSDKQEDDTHFSYGITLVDHTTEKKYNLYIQNGKLTMALAEGEE